MPCVQQRVEKSKKPCYLMRTTRALMAASMELARQWDQETCSRLTHIQN